MRTTLKRGSTHEWERGGNGRAARPAGAPPRGPLTPVSRYGRRRRGPLRLLGTILAWTLVALLVAAGALAGGTWLYLNKSLTEIRAHTPEAREAEKALDVPLPGKPATALVIGYDKRQGVDKVAESRSDTMMLIRADPESETISLLSFPRDLIVDIPACREQPPLRARINEAYTRCGTRGAIETVRNLTGIPINYFITVNFRGFKQIVDNVGGVYLDIDRRYFNDVSGPGGYATIDLHPGYQKVAGARALDFVRYRHTDSDFYRIKRQQEFVKSFKQQVAANFGITKLPGIVETITENVEIGAGGSRQLDVGTIYGYAKLAYGLPTGNFFQLQIDPNQLTGYAELSAPEAAVQAAVNEFLSPDAAAAEKATSAATGEEPRTQGAPAPGEVSVEVLNGNGRAGSADEAAVALGERGYQTTVGGNADNWNYFETSILYPASDDRAEAAANAVADLFGDAVVEPLAAGTEITTSIRVIVGQTFQGTIGPGPVDDTPEHVPAVTSRDTEARALLTQARGKVEFPLLVPTVREQGSAVDGEEGLRVYRVGGGDAVRIVYRMGSGEYYGIQQLSWTEPPVLASPSLTRQIGAREYRLYFNASKLHIVAFEENGAVYWVVNSILDRLSNETMLAIAKGLKPLG
jgi:LCP family protein required for cell wall assembly